MDQSLWQTLGAFDVLRSSHKWVQTMLSCGKKTAQQCRLGLFQDSDFAGYLEDSKSTSGGLLCIFGSHTFVPISWMCKKQTSVSHRSANGWNSRSWSLGFGYWSVAFFFQPIKETRECTGKLDAWCMTRHQENEPRTKSRLQLSTTILNYATSIVLLNPVQCFTFFEDMKRWSRWSLKGGSPTMRHVSRTHRVAPDWSFDRINLDPKIPIKYVDTKHQLADLLTKGNPTRDECNNLLNLFNISIFSKLPRIDVEKNAARNRRRNNCGKVEADVESGSAFWGKLSYSAELDCIQSPGDSESTQSTRFESHSTKCRETCWRFKSKWRSVKFSSVANRCKVNWAKVRGNFAAADTSQSQSFPESARKLAAENVDINDEAHSKWPRNFRISRAYIPHLEKVDANLRRQFRRRPEDIMDDLNLNTMIWGTFILVTPRAEVYLGKNCLENLHSTKNQPQGRCNQEACQWTDRNSWNIRDQLARRILEEDDSVELPRSAVVDSKGLRIFWFSVVHGKNQWKSRKRMEGENRLVYEVIPMPWSGSIRRRADGIRVEDFPITLQILTEILKMMTEKKRVNLSTSQVRIIFMSMYNDTVWWEKGNEDMCIAIFFSGLDQKRSGTEPTRTNRMENRIESLRTWCSTSVKADTPNAVHPVLWNEEIWKTRGKGTFVYTLLWRRQNRWSGSPPDHLRQAA